MKKIFFYKKKEMNLENRKDILRLCLTKLDGALIYYSSEYKTGGNVEKSDIDLLKLLKKQILEALEKDDISKQDSYKLYQSVRYCNLVVW